MMASIQKIEGKKGISYKLVVDLGRDSDGKKVRHTKTWRPDPDIKKNEIEKAALKAAFDFERSIELGYIVNDRQTFEQYAAYVLELKERTGIKHSTIAAYRDLLEKIQDFKLEEGREMQIILATHSSMLVGGRWDETLDLYTLRNNG